MTKEELITHIQEQLDWWHDDMTYKAPEQLNAVYITAIFNDIRGHLEEPAQDSKLTRFT